MNYYISCLVLFVMLLAAPVFAQPKCDGVTDDTAAIQAEFNTADAGCTTSGYDGSVRRGGKVTLPSTLGGVCKISGTLTLDASCVAYDGNGEELWQSNSAASPAFIVNTTQNSYGTQVVRGLKMEGKSPVGVLVAGNQITFEDLRVWSFGTNVQIGNWGYVDYFIAPFLFDANLDFSCPYGISDAGEQIIIVGGGLFNSANAISNYGCHIGISHASIDAITNLPVDNEGGQFIADDVHFEMQSKIPGAFIKNAGCNAYGHVDVGQSEFYSDPGVGGPVIENDGNPPCGGSGPYSKIHNDFFSGFNPNPTVIGTTPGQVALCANTSGSGGGTMNNIPNQGNCTTE